MRNKAKKPKVEKHFSWQNIKKSFKSLWRQPDEPMTAKQKEADAHYREANKWMIVMVVVMGIALLILWIFNKNLGT